MRRGIGETAGPLDRQPEESAGAGSAPAGCTDERGQAFALVGAAPAAGRTTGFVTFPERMQRVQARTRRLPPPGAAARTLFKFRCHLRFVTLFAWLTRWPDFGVFPQN